MMGAMLLHPVAHVYSSLFYYLEIELKQWQKRAGGGERIAQFRVHNLLLVTNNLGVLSQLNKNRLNQKCIQKIIRKFLRENTIWASLE
jgi:hypothetical protein